MKNSKQAVLGCFYPWTDVNNETINMNIGGHVQIFIPFDGYLEIGSLQYIVTA